MDVTRGPTYETDAEIDGAIAEACVMLGVSPGPVVWRWNRRFTRRMGAATPAGIELSAPLWSRATPAQRRQTIVHEVCHLVAGLGHGHGPCWRAAMRHCGLVPLRYHSVDRTGLVRRTRHVRVYCGCVTSLERSALRLVSAARATKMRRGWRYVCRRCRQDLSLQVPGRPGWQHAEVR